jgi:hypothetical protein
MEVCITNESYYCSWQLRNNIIDVQNRRYVIRKDGSSISQVDLGIFSTVIHNLFILTKQLLFNNSLTANFVDDGGTQKIRFSTMFASTGFAYSDWSFMDIIDTRVNLALINTIAYNPFL